MKYSEAIKDQCNNCHIALERSPAPGGLFQKVKHVVWTPECLSPEQYPLHRHPTLQTWPGQWLYLRLPYIQSVFYKGWQRATRDYHPPRRPVIDTGINLIISRSFCDRCMLASLFTAVTNGLAQTVGRGTDVGIPQLAGLWRHKRSSSFTRGTTQYQRVGHHSASWSRYMQTYPGTSESWKRSKHQLRDVSH